MFLYPIAKWQRVSYNSEKISCQFHPNCSLYGARAIHSKGAVAGSIITYDRIVRCNESALFNHNTMGGSFHSDGRLIDPMNQNQYIKTNRTLILKPFIYLIPGIGRAYAGRRLDGMMGFWTVYLTTSSAIYAYKNKNQILGPILLGVAGITYLGEVYCAWRAERYYQNIENGNN